MADRVLVMHEGRLDRASSRAPRPTRSRVDPRGDRPAGGAHERARRRRPAAPPARAGAPPWSTRSSASASSASSASLALLVLGHGDRRAALPQRQNRCATSLLNVVDLRAARRRPDARVITRNVDLSVGSVLGHQRVPDRRPVRRPPRHRDPGRLRARDRCSAPPAALLNGVARRRWAGCPSLVVTLGTLYVFRGLDFLWANGRQVNAADTARRLPQPRHATRSLGVPILALIALVVVLVVGQWLRDYRAGPRAVRDRLQPRGARGSPASASDRRVLGRVRRSPARSPASAGVLFTARFGTVDATAGTGYELTVDRRGRRRRRRDLRRHRHASTAPRSARCCSARSRSSLIVLQVDRVLAAGRSIGALLLVAIAPRPAPRRCASRPPCARRSARRAAEAPHRAPRRARPAHDGATARSAAGRRCSSR